MKCPHCDRAVSLFSPSVNRLQQHRKKCPHCGAPVRTSIRHKKTLLAILGAALFGMVAALTLSDRNGMLLLLAGAAVAVIVGIVGLAEFELVSCDEPGKRHS
jgi:uncharacterized paraquat-inducible protein A